jgi:hypothetical protein
LNAIGVGERLKIRLKARPALGSVIQSKNVVWRSSGEDDSQNEKSEQGALHGGVSYDYERSEVRQKSE